LERRRGLGGLTGHWTYVKERATNRKKKRIGEPVWRSEVKKRKKLVGQVRKTGKKGRGSFFTGETEH